LGDFVLKTAPMLRFDESKMMLASILPNLSNFDGKKPSNQCPKFGSAQKMLYLCIVNQKTGAHSK